MTKIAMKTPIVEMDGDEMTRVLWAWVKDKLLTPYVDLKTEYYDLGLKHRDDTDDKVTMDAAEATKRLGVAVKCATITPNADRVKEYTLKKQWKSPNGTIRAALDGTTFRKPILVPNITPSVASWKKPIIVGRHSYGDVYQNVEIAVPGPGKAELVFAGADGREQRVLIHEFKGPGILQGIHNTEKSIRSFARACFNCALDEKVDMWFATKDTISKTYDQTFKLLFQDEFENGYQDRFKAAGIEYFYTLIDDVVARVMKGEGGILWACKNYDGDVMSDMVASAFGSLAMMTSVLVSPDGCSNYEAAHGTVQKHYYKHLKGEKTSTNSMALIFAWTGAMRKRGEIDTLPELVAFAGRLEQASLKTITDGVMTGDLARLATPPATQVVGSEEFLDAIAERLKNYQFLL
jgi:isocitrate dehydrogenase